MTDLAPAGYFTRTIWAMSFSCNTEYRAGSAATASGGMAWAARSVALLSVVLTKADSRLNVTTADVAASHFIEYLSSRRGPLLAGFMSAFRRTHESLTPSTRLR